MSLPSPITLGKIQPNLSVLNLSDSKSGPELFSSRELKDRIQREIAFLSSNVQILAARIKVYADHFKEQTYNFLINVETLRNDNHIRKEALIKKLTERRLIKAFTVHIINQIKETEFTLGQLASLEKIYSRSDEYDPDCLKNTFELAVGILEAKLLDSNPDEEECRILLDKIVENFNKLQKCYRHYAQCLQQAAAISARLRPVQTAKALGLTND